MRKVVNIDALVDEARASLIIVGGAEHRVLQISGAEMLRLASVQADEDTAALAALLDVVRRIVPTLSPAVFEALSVDQLTAIVGVARAAIDAVEASIEAEPAPGN